MEGYELITTPAQALPYAESFWKSGLFTDLVSQKAGLTADMQREIGQSKAVVKILAGAEMGLKPIFSMQKLYIVDGQIYKSAQVCAALINQSAQYRYKTIKKTATEAEIDFYAKIDDKWELAHKQTYSIEDAKRSNLANRATYQKDPAEMLWNRCMTRGSATVAADVIGGLPSIEDRELETGTYREIPSGALPEDVELLAEAQETEPEPKEELKVEPKPKARKPKAEKAKEEPEKVEEESPIGGDLSVDGPTIENEGLDDAFEEDAPEEPTESAEEVKPRNREPKSATEEQNRLIQDLLSRPDDKNQLVAIVSARAKSDDAWKGVTPGTLSEYQAAILLHVQAGGDASQIT